MYSSVIGPTLSTSFCFLSGFDISKPELTHISNTRALTLFSTSMFPGAPKYCPQLKWTHETSE